jgi:NAD(P)-dependent dehydrogenase (short-subunit alcohol dehydrogenase family)
VGRLDGKVALITGAGSGLGRVGAELFAAEGAQVVVAEAVEEAGRATVDAITRAGGEAAFVATDVSQSASVARMIAFTVDTFGGLHVLYNNAGILPAEDGRTEETPEEVWDRVMAVNLKGVWLCCRHGIPAMIPTGGGSVINVASLVAIMGSAVPQIAYTASKGGVLSMTREMAVEYARTGVRINALCPGPIQTPLMAQLLADAEQRARRLVHVPIGRFGEASEVARAALFLASDDSSLMTGASLVVDGGISVAYVTPE